MTGDARARLARQMNDRRLQLRRSWSEIARRAGMDESNLRRIRSGKIEISDLAERGLEDALELEAGDIRAVLERADAELTPRDDRTPASTGRKRRPARQQAPDPLTASAEEIIEFLDEVREVEGEDAYRELLAETLDLQRAAIRGQAPDQRRTRKGVDN